ncbi:MAG: cytochrome c [Chlorobium sp.]
MKPILILLPALLLAPLAAPEAHGASTGPDGKALFDRNCGVCHSVNPPPKSAPPIVPIASAYHRQFASKAAGVSHMAAFLKSPSKAASKVDPEAITRFGLMPPVALGDAELKAVAGWVWDQYNSNMGQGVGGSQNGGNGNCR